MDIGNRTVRSPYHRQPYGQPTYGYEQPQYGRGGWGPPPPPKKNTGATVSVVVIVVLVLGGLGITGFVAPGFFLSDDNQTGSGTTTSTPQTTTSADGPSGSDAENVLAAVADGLDAQDTDGLGELPCADAKSNVEQAMDDADAVDAARLVDSDVSDSEAVGKVEVTVGSEAVCSR